MGFRNPITSVASLDTGNSSGGVRVYGTTTAGGFPQGVIEFFNSLTPPARWTSTPLTQNVGGLLTSLGTRTHLVGLDDSSHGVTGPSLDLNVEEDPVGGFMGVARLLAGGLTLTLTPYGLSLSGDPAWTSYNADWRTVGGAPSLGTGGSVVGKYWRLGRLCVADIFLTAGTGFNGGTGAWSFALPFAAASGREQYGTAKAFTVAGDFMGQGLIASAATRITPKMPNAQGDNRLNAVMNATSGGAPGTGTPAISGAYTFGDGSNLGLVAVYETAAGV